eukprot:SAG31_NODE_4130_length_3555_cov_7.058449_1_plen_122_part_10
MCAAAQPSRCDPLKLSTFGHGHKSGHDLAIIQMKFQFEISAAKGPDLFRPPAGPRSRDEVLRDQHGYLHSVYPAPNPTFAVGDTVYAQLKARAGAQGLDFPINPNQSQSIPINPNQSQSIPI